MFFLENLMLDMKTPSSWVSGVNDEIQFWDNWLRTNGAQWPDEYRRRMNPFETLSTDLAGLLDPDGSHLAVSAPSYSILDVGAGPLTSLGKVLPHGLIHITAIDALAESYDALLLRHGINPPVRTQFGLAENVAGGFRANSFDLVVAQNSLDHAIDPIAAIRGMLMVAKPQRYLCLTHSENEGKKENYSGFHRFDFSLDEKDHFIVHRSGVSRSVNELFSAGADFSVQRFPDIGWFRVLMRKRQQPLISNTSWTGHCGKAI